MQSMLMRVDEIAAATGLKRSSAYRLAMRLKRVKSQGGRPGLQGCVRGLVAPEHDRPPKRRYPWRSPGRAGSPGVAGFDEENEECGVQMGRPCMNSV